MAIPDLNLFLAQYFTAHHCDLLYNEDGVLTVQLSEDMDKALMNRPFYWHYIKKMGYPGQPKQLTLITNPNKREENGEWIHFGSPRLQQILTHLRENQKYTKLFQKVETNQRMPLYPWLVLNIKISYHGKQKKDEILSIGLHLINGMMRLQMMGELRKRTFQATISDYCYTISPMIRLKSGYLRIEKVIMKYLDDQPYDWANQSLKKLDEEIETLKHFYDEDNSEEEMEKEITELKLRYEPYVTFEVINGGLFYLTEA